MLAIMNNLLPLILAAFSLALQTSPTTAQEAREVTVRTLCFQQNDNIKSLFIQGAPKSEAIEIPLWTRAPSDDIKLKLEDNRMVFCIKAQNSEGDAILQPVAKTTLGEGGRFLLFFVPGTDGENAYKVKSFPDDEKSFPMGSTRIINFTPVNAYFRLGEHEVTLKPGEVKVVPMPKKVNQYKDYSLVIELDSKNGRYPVRETRGKASDSKRDLAVIYLDPKAKRANVNLYKDIPPWTLPPIPES